MKLIFLLSLPRSGSTLAQRIVAAHPLVGTSSEPWIMLPWVFARRNLGLSAVYNQRLAAQAVRDFMAGIPNGEQVYRTAVRDAAYSIYAAAANGQPYFLDKTPRYHLIVDELLSLFPDAHFLILWRNPLAVASSMLRTWSRNGRWNLHQFSIDLYAGVENLVSAYGQDPDRFRVLRYEDMVSRPDTVWPEVMSWFGLDYREEMLAEYRSVHLSGRMGDPNATRYPGVSASPILGWEEAFCNPARRLWALRYLDWLGESRLSTMGYKLSELRSILMSRSLSMDGLVADGFMMAWGALHPILGLSRLRERLSAVTGAQRIYSLN